MLLEVDDLHTHYTGRGQRVRAVDGVTFSLSDGENLGLVGESGCGKTTMSKSLLRILGENAEIAGGRISFDGTDLTSMSESEMNRFRWKEISMITQSAMNALDPVYTAADQIIETLRIHTDMTKADARSRSVELFELVGLNPARLGDYPHQLSGGMRQRVVIALALALDPRLIIADEPTTALDVVVQDGILRQLGRIQERLGNSMILVTHDVSVVAEVCHRVAVMYAGRIAEIGTSHEIFNNASHPYTMGLLSAYPTLESAKGELISIPGSPPDLSQPTAGCPFAQRCPFSTEICELETPPDVEVSAGHISACHHAERAEQFRRIAGEQSRWMRESQLTEKTRRAQAIKDLHAASAPQASTEAQNATAMLALENIRRLFPVARTASEIIRRVPQTHVRAIDGVTFDVGESEIVGLAGESGSGKSTLGEVIVGLQPKSEGTLSFRGRPLFEDRKQTAAMRRIIQMAFQDPYETLNPRFTIYQTVVEPLQNFRIGADDGERRVRVIEALEQVELLPAEAYLDRYPHELSGGQRQRVAIARAIVCGPSLLVADEPVSMLDVSIRAGVLNLFRRFRNELGMSIVYVSHDLATIRYICDRTAILYLGRLAEIGPTEEVIERPKHPYTKLLLSAVPRANPDEERAHVDARGEIPSPINLPNGCRFHARCPHAMARCGWEGKDLARIIRARLADAERTDEAIAAGAEVDESGGPTQAVDPLEIEVLRHAQLTVSGPDLRIATTPARRDEALEATKRVLNASLTTIGEAVKSVESEGGNAFVVSFASAAEPDFYDTGERHKVACYLFEGDGEETISISSAGPGPKTHANEE